MRNLALAWNYRSLIILTCLSIQFGTFVMTPEGCQFEFNGPICNWASSFLQLGTLFWQIPIQWFKLLRPKGPLDHVVWPLAYGLSCRHSSELHKMCLAKACIPKRSSGWTSVPRDGQCTISLNHLLPWRFKCKHHQDLGHPRYCLTQKCLMHCAWWTCY